MEKIKNKNRILVAVVAVMMLLVYFVPIWQVNLKAPMYPEGLGMHIWLYNVTGSEEFDLRNINLLNHYVGMKEIHKSMFPEFLVLPYVMAFMIFGAIITLIFPRRFLVHLGLGNLVLVAVAGLFDYYQWGYDYGHNLKEGAPLVIPGMAYQPPLLGCKELLNFVACSWPHWGGWLLVVCGLLLVYIIVDEYRFMRRQKESV